MSRKTLTIRIFLSIVYSVLFLEGYLHLLGCRWFYSKETEYLSPPYTYEMRNCSPKEDFCRDVNGKYIKLVSITRQGLRSPEYKGEAVKYIVLGNSAAFSGEVDDMFAWPALTARRINEKLGQNKIWIGNAGFPGMNIVQNIMQLRYLVPRLDPQGVILNVGLNDATYFAEHGFLPQLGQNRKEAIRSYREAFPVPSVKRLLALEKETPFYKKTYVYQFMEEFKLHLLEQKLKNLVGQWFPQFSALSKRKALKERKDIGTINEEVETQYKEIFAQLVQEAQKMGLDVIVVGTPLLKSDSVLKGINAAIEDVCRKKEIMFFNPEEYISTTMKESPESASPEKAQEYRDEKKYLFANGHHYHEKGAWWLSDHLSDFLMKRNNGLN